jgi:hypothetical protein
LADIKNSMFLLLPQKPKSDGITGFSGLPR